jgi:dolichol-phosphate mannosyltransferase
MSTFSIIIPVYRNQETVEPLFRALKDVLSHTNGQHDAHFIFVNDGSDDDSLTVLEKLCAQNPGITVLSLSRNFGQVPAILAGLDHASGDGILIMSADLQDPVDLIPKMIAAWESGAEVVVAHRRTRNDPFADKAASRFFYRLMRFSNLKLPDGGFDFVLLDQKAHQALKMIKGRNRFLQGDILWIGFDTRYIPYDREARKTGKSQWKLGRKLKYFIDGVLSTSYWPIRLMSFIGLLTALSSFAYVLIIVYMRLMHQTPFNGWAPIMVIMLFLGGMVMIMLGVIGEYVWRIFDEVRGRPDYIVKDLKQSKNEDA